MRDDSMIDLQALQETFVTALLDHVQHTVYKPELLATGIYGLYRDLGSPIRTRAISMANTPIALVGSKNEVLHHRTCLAQGITHVQVAAIPTPLDPNQFTLCRTVIADLQQVDKSGRTVGPGTRTSQTTELNNQNLPFMSRERAIAFLRAEEERFNTSSSYHFMHMDPEITWKRQNAHKVVELLAPTGEETPFYSNEQLDSGLLSSQAAIEEISDRAIEKPLAVPLALTCEEAPTCPNEQSDKRMLPPRAAVEGTLGLMVRQGLVVTQSGPKNKKKTQTVDVFYVRRARHVPERHFG